MTGRRRKAYYVLLAVVLVALVTGAALAAPGRIDTYDPKPGKRATAGETPDWAGRCLKTEPRRDRKLVHRCGLVRGRVIWTKTQTGKTQEKIHLLLVSRFTPYLAKLPPGMKASSMVSTVTVTGPVVEGRNGVKEIQVVTRD